MIWSSKMYFHRNARNSMKTQSYQLGLCKMWLISYISSVSFKKQNLTAKNQIIIIYINVLSGTANLIGIFLHYSPKRDFWTRKSNQKGALGRCFLLSGEPASDDQGVKQDSWFFNLPVPFSSNRNGRGKRKCLNDIKAQRAKTHK